MSNLLTRIFNGKTEQELSTIKQELTEVRKELSEQTINGGSGIYGTVNFTSSDSYTQSKAMKLAVAYRCVNVISDSIAVMEINNFITRNNWKQKQTNNLFNLLNIAPNKFMSAYTFKKHLVQNVLLSGNAYILIRRDSQDNINELILLDPATVQVVSMNNDIFYNVISSSYYNLPAVEAKVYDKSDIIHILNFSLNNFVGVSTLVYANLVLGTAYSSEVQANNFFTSNNVLTGLVVPVAGNSLSPKQADEAKKQLIKNVAENTAGGNSFIVLGDGLDYKPIQSSPRESMLIENREFSGLQVAQFFGVTPSKVFLDKKLNETNTEQQQLEFLNSTLLPLMEKIEIEMFRKLFVPVEYSFTDLKFNVNSLLRLDKNTQADVHQKYFQLCVYTTNEIRSELDCDYPVTGGNRPMILQNAQPLDNILNDVKANINGGNNNNNNTNNNNNGQQ